MTARAATSFTVDDTGRAGVVRATGEVDAASSAAFRSALEQAVALGRPLVVVDLADVSFLDSAGLSVVFGVQRELPVDRQLALDAEHDRQPRGVEERDVGQVDDDQRPSERHRLLERGAERRGARRVHLPGRPDHARPSGVVDGEGRRCSCGHARSPGSSDASGS